MGWDRLKEVVQLKGTEEQIEMQIEEWHLASHHFDNLFV